MVRLVKFLQLPNNDYEAPLLTENLTFCKYNKEIVSRFSQFLKVSLALPISISLIGIFIFLILFASANTSVAYPVPEEKSSLPLHTDRMTHRRYSSSNQMFHLS